MSDEETPGVVFDRCGETLLDEATAIGWPVPVIRVRAVGGIPTEDLEYVGPCCLDGYCPEGHVLRGDTDSSDCPTPGCPHNAEGES